MQDERAMKACRKILCLLDSNTGGKIGAGILARS